ncbi:hypothetical protein K438DRAFT_1805666, partial [Mycena galopus ATCC 62051]
MLLVVCWVFSHSLPLTLCTGIGVCFRAEPWTVLPAKARAAGPQFRDKPMDSMNPVDHHGLYIKAYCKLAQREFTNGLL